MYAYITVDINSQGGYAEYKILLTNLQQTHSDMPNINKDLYNTGKATNKFSTQSFGTLSEILPKTYKSGGTMLGTTGCISGRIEDKRADGKGRWIWVQLTRRKDKKGLITSVYRVSQTYSSKAGYSTTYMQQNRAFIKENITKPKPKKRCILDLATFL